MNLANNFKTINENIKQAESQFHRAPNSVQLLAVSKTQGSEKIREVWQLGQKAFGENYLQEALSKIEALKDTDIEWHFIGPIQNNKTRKIAENFSWVHTLDNEKTAQRLNDQRPENLLPLNVCIQINIDEEQTKSGVFLSDQERIMSLISTIIENMPQLHLRGLMIIPKITKNEKEQRETFRKLQNLLNDINDTLRLKQVKPLDTLSMGMSHDYIAAIAEGATIVRLGTALFGEREKC